MAKLVLPSKEILLRLLRYDSVTGKLYWRERLPEQFRDGIRNTAVQKANQFNSQYAGQEALCTKERGYRVGNLFGRRVYAHRVIWKMVTGEEPEIIDHKDGDGSNNRFENFRSGSQAINAQNQAIRVNNTSGVTGVYFNKKLKKWSAFIGYPTQALGTYHEFSDAVAARQRAERALGYHPNHGKRLSAAAMKATWISPSRCRNAPRDSGSAEGVPAIS